MKGKIKRYILCLLAVSMMTAGGNIYADDETVKVSSESSEEDESAEEAEKSRKDKRSEAVEKTEFNAELAEKYYSLSGSAEGIDFYTESEDFEDKIWAEFGFSEGEPDRKAELTEKQEAGKDAAEELIKEVKKLGDAVAVYTDTGEPAAEFKKLSSKSGERSFISTKGRFLVTVNEDTGKLISVRTVISTLDSENAFFRDGGKVVDLMQSDNKKLDESFAYKRTEDGMKVYENEDGSEFVWVSEDGTHYYGAFSYTAENDNFRMIVDHRSAIFGIENKDTGYIWWSSPLGATQDTYATDLLVDELRSSNTLNYGVPENRNNNNLLRSGYDSDCKMTVKNIKDGIRITYDYSSAGFRYPVDYTLEDDHMKAYLKVDDIEETNSANIATQITVLGSFGAASSEEEGYFIIPDGSGALVRFNNGRTMGSNAYMQRVYGNDVTVVPTSKGAVTEQIYLPMYGIVKEDNAMLVVASKGDSNALLSVKASKQSNTSYNLCNFTFIVRGTDTFYMSGSNEELTVFERGDINSDDIELLYYPIAKDGADYVDVAARYRDYLVEEKGVKNRTSSNSSALYVDLFGGVLKKKPILGIPITMKTAVTTYDQAVDILTELRDNGVDDMVVSYANWTNDGIKNKVDTGAKPSNTLGGKKDFKSLKSFINDNGYELYPVSDNRDFYSGNGYYSFTSTAVRVSGSYSRIVSYDRAYGIPDGFKKNMSLLSPTYFNKVLGKVADSYDNKGLDGVSIANLTTSLYGDYGKKDISRFDAMNKLIRSYQEMDSTLDNGILADNANAYALPYVSRIKNVPLSSSRFDMFDEDIPFFQLVMHGLIPYSTSAVNGSADAENLILMAAATGSDIQYDMLHTNTTNLKDTEFDIYYYANYKSWTETAAAEYKLLQPIISNVSDSTITGYSKDGDLITTTYSNGTVVKVDFKAKTINFNGEIIDVEKYAEEGGIKF